MIEATYSAEDNKLRLYSASRLDDETYQTIKNAGFRWAPKQELFVAPAWSPEREDICVELAGEITAEQTTLAERAEAKAERLDNLACKRERESNAFHNAATEISRRFEFGQPILVGHHSERRARKDQDRMQSAMDKAVKAHKAVSYWQYKAEGVERHANYKNDPSVRARRIKKLLAELRDLQRSVNHAHICLDLWTKISAEQCPDKRAALALKYAGIRLKTGGTAPWEMWSDLDKGEITADEAIKACISMHEVNTHYPPRERWMAHTLNRLAYERSELGPVARYEGELSAVILQAFAREHGAHKPKAVKLDCGHWTVTSSAPLPAHICPGKELTANPDQWRDLMQSAGYTVPAPKARAASGKNPPLINPDPESAEKLQKLWNDAALEKGKDNPGRVESRHVRIVEQAHYSECSRGDYGPMEAIAIDAEGRRVWPHRKNQGEPVCRVRICTSGASFYSADQVVVIEGKPTKPLPLEV
jgi:hypothetical protein